MIGEFDFFVLFPNFVLLLFNVGNTTSYVSYNFWPLAVDRTILGNPHALQEARDPRASGFQQEYFKCIIRDTLQEDAGRASRTCTRASRRARSHT